MKFLIPFFKALSDIRVLDFLDGRVEGVHRGRDPRSGKVEPRQDRRLLSQLSASRVHEGDRPLPHRLAHPADQS